MGSENFNVLEELKSLDEQVSVVPDLAGLKPIFYRLDEIAKQYSDDFEVQLVVGDVKQHLVSRGARLKEQRDKDAGAPVLPTTITLAAVPPPPPPIGSGEPTLISPPPQAGPPPFTGPPPFPPEPLLPTAPMAVPPVPSADPDFSWVDTEASTPGGGRSGPPTLPPFAPPNLPSMAMPAAGQPGQAPPNQSAPAAPPPPPPTTRPPVDWKRAMWVGAVGGAIIAIVLLAVVINMARNRNAKPAVDSTEVAVDIVTTPPGASVRVNSETKCTSDCKLSLPPGNYQITAFLDGYEPFASGVTLVSGEPKALNLTLEPQAQSVRILTDFEKGKVALDGQDPADLQDGSYLYEKVPPGSHTVKVTAGNNEASFSFELADAKLPSVTGNVTAKNVVAVLVSSFANQAHVVTSNGPWKLAVNGQQEGDASPAGVDLKSFQAGVDELIIGDGKDQYNMKESFSPAPMLTAKILRPDQNMGTLIVATEENDVAVFVNNRQWPRRTARGQLRIPAMGTVTVRVSKQGFEDVPAQKAEVKKGEEVRLEFKLKAAAQFSSLEVTGGTPGTEVRVDQRSIGTLGGDGGFRNASVTPGEHTIELARPQFVSRSFKRNFAAGQTISLSGLDVLLAAEKVAPAPAPEAPKPPPPAPKAPAPPPPPRVLGMDSFDDPSQWKEENGVYRHRGQGFFIYKVPPNGGVITFNAYLIRGGGLLRGGRLRWRVGYVDDKNYTLFELDDDTLYSKDVVNGKSTDRPKQKHGVPSKDKKDKVWAIKVDISGDTVIHQIQKDQDWVTIDTFSPAGRKPTDGKFGFLLQGGGDEMGLSDLTFKPR